VTRFFLLSLMLGLWLPAGAQSALDSYTAGQQAFQRDDYWSAVDRFRQALQVNPRYLEAYQGLSESFFALGEYDEAAKQISEALKLGKLNSTVNNLQGRILLGQTKLEEALAVFQSVLSREPKNQGALFGLAEYQVMKGRLELASQQFENLRREDPANLRALLSILYVASARGDRATFDRVASDAIRLYSSDPRVHFAIAWEAWNRKDMPGARSALDKFLVLSGKDDLRGWLFQIELLLAEHRDQEALLTIDESVIKGPQVMRASKDPRVWYLRALALTRTGRNPEASDSFRMALTYEPDNETWNLAYETWLLRQTLPEDKLRAPQAQLHFSRAADLTKKNSLNLALDEWRRGLALNPYSVQGRLGRADIWKRQGYKTSSLEELEAVAVLQPTYKDVGFLDEVEIQRGVYSDSLAAGWGLSLKDLDGLNSVGTSRLFRPFEVGLFHANDASSTQEFEAGAAFAEMFADEWDSMRTLHLARASEFAKVWSVSGFNQAFLQARSSGLDYFALLELRQGPRDFQADLKLYLGRTGRLIQTFSIYKKGLLPVTLGLRELAATSVSAFPLRGSIAKRQNAEFLVNLGRRDGVSVKQKFSIVRNSGSVLTGDKSWFSWNPNDLFGTWTVSSVDDWISVGKMEKSGFFDTVAIGDEVLFVKDAPASPAYVPLPVTAVLQRDLLSLR